MAVTGRCVFVLLGGAFRMLPWGREAEEQGRSQGEMKGISLVKATFNSLKVYVSVSSLC